MAKIIDISSKLTNDKPSIKVGDTEYPVNNSVELVFRFEELQAKGDFKSLMEAFNEMLGADAVENMGLKTWALPNIQTLTIALMAAIQDVDFEVAEGRFRKTIQG